MAIQSNDAQRSLGDAYGAMQHAKDERYAFPYLYDAAAADKKYVENAVNELLADKPVTTPSARAVGCGIKWKGV